MINNSILVFGTLWGIGDVFSVVLTMPCHRSMAGLRVILYRGIYLSNKNGAVEVRMPGIPRKISPCFSSCFLFLQNLDSTQLVKQLDRFNPILSGPTGIRAVYPRSCVWIEYIHHLYIVAKGHHAHM